MSTTGPGPGPQRRDTPPPDASVYRDADLAGVLAHDALDAQVADAPGAAVPSTLLAAALAARPAGVPTGPWAADAATPLDGWRRTEEELAEVVAGLPAAAWDAPVPWAQPGWRARDLLAHLTAIERYTASRVGGAFFDVAEEVEADHVGVSLATVEALRVVPIATVKAAWAEALAEAARALTARSAQALGDDAAGGGAQVQFHTLPMSLQTLLVARTFEVWTHTDDLRRAAGAALQAPDGARLRLMSHTAVRSIALGMALAGRPRPGRTARIVLTGPGGGAWSQALAMGEAPGGPDTLIVADVVDFCRLAAKRLTPEQLDCSVEGDRALASDVLAGAAVFAA